MSPAEFAQTWLPNLIAVSALGYTVLIDRRTARRSALEEIEQKIAELDDAREQGGQRLTRLEGRLEQMPDQATVHRIELTVARVEGEIKSQNATIASIAKSSDAAAASVQRIENWMMEKE